MPGSLESLRTTQSVPARLQEYPSPSSRRSSGVTCFVATFNSAAYQSSMLRSRKGVGSARSVSSAVIAHPLYGVPCSSQRALFVATATERQNHITINNACHCQETRVSSQFQIGTRRRIPSRREEVHATAFAWRTSNSHEGERRKSGAHASSLSAAVAPTATPDA